MGDLQEKASRTRTCAVVLAAALIAIAAAAPTAGAKKGGGKVSVTQPVNQLVPDGDAPFGLLTSTIEVGNKFKGKRIRDVNVTLQTTGTAPGSPARDLNAVLIAPNGASTLLFAILFGTGPIGTTPVSIGPLTLDDEAGLYLGSSAARDPYALYDPWVGSARPAFDELYPMDGGAVKGTWTLKVTDRDSGETSVLNFWRLDVKVGKPYRTG